jgi:HK97 family phage major capsid protein
VDINELIEKRNALHDELKALAAKPDATADDEARADAALTEIDTLDVKIERQRKIAKVQRAEELREVAESIERGEATIHAPQIMRRVDTDIDVLRSLPSEQRDAALKTLEVQRGVELSDAQLTQVERLVRSENGNTDGTKIAKRLLLTERPAYRSAFVKVFHALGTEPGLTDDERRAMAEFRSAALSPDSAGGFGVPVLIDPTIILTSQGSSNAVYNAARKVTITTDEWRGVSSAGVTWSWDGEAAAVSNDAPTLAQPTVPVFKAQGFIPYSIEIGQDYPNFAGEMSRLLVSGYMELLAQAMIVGTGSSQPTGIAVALNATSSEVLPTTDGAFGAVDVYALWDALPERFRANARWLSSTDTMNDLRRFASGSSNSDANFTVNITQEAVPRLFGREYMTSEYMADFTGTTGQSDYLIVGDFDHYLVAQRAGMNVELVPMLFDVTNNRPTGQRGWYAWARVGADSIVDNAFRMLANT